MSNPSNFYAEKILAQHPLAMWSLEDESYYLTKISEADRNISSWTKINATATTVTDTLAPFSSSYITQVTGTATPTWTTEGQSFLSSTSSLTSNGFTISFYLKTQYITNVSAGFGTGETASVLNIFWNASYLTYETSSNHGFSTGDYVQVTGSSAGGESVYDTAGTITKINDTNFRISSSVSDYGNGTGGIAIKAKTESQFINPADYPTNSWIPVSFTFSDNVSNQKILLGFTYSQTSPEFFINGLTVGKDSQPFNGESLGQTSVNIPTSIATTQTNAIEAKSYGTQEHSAYYICDSNTIYAKNSGVSMCYGSDTSMRIYPHATSGQPSFIFPGFGMLNEFGRYKATTLQALIRITAENSTPKRIIGPIASTDGIYVAKNLISLKIGDSIGSYYFSNMYQPTVLQLKISEGSAKLSLDGEEAISLLIDNAALSLPLKLNGSNKNQDWFGIYAYTDVPLIEIGSLAIFPYLSSEVAAKLNLVYAQSIDVPQISNSLFGETIAPDFTVSDYVNNYNYPSFQAKWEQSTVLDNLNILDTVSLSTKDFIKPGTKTSLYDSSKLFLDIYETLTASADSNTFITLRPSTVVAGSSRSWSTNQGYFSLNLPENNEYISNCIYGVFKSLESSATEQVLIKIQNTLDGNYFQISLINTTVYYKYKYNSETETQITTKSITQNTSFAVGVDIQKLIKSDTNLFGFFANKTNLEIFVGGKPELTNTFSGNIYKVGLCSKQNFSDILSLFNSSGILADTSINIGTQTPTISSGKVTLTTSTAHGFRVGDLVTISGLTPSGYNGTFTITAVPTTTSFTFVNATTGNITIAGSVVRIFQSIFLDKIASYTLYGFDAFNKINLETATSGYWQDYVPLSKLAKTVISESGQEALELDLIQINIDYEEPRTYESSNFVTSGLPVKSYITFQTLDSEVNKQLSEFTTSQSANENRFIDASTFSSTTKYEFVNGMAIRPPKNVDLSTLAIVVHIDISTNASTLKPIVIKNLQLSAQSFNKNLPNKLGTKYDISLYPYEIDYNTALTTYPYNYNSKNPYLIYKESTPHLYLTRHSGFRILGNSPSFHRGLYANIGNFSPDKKIVSIQMSMLADIKSFATGLKLFLLQTNNETITFSIVSAVSGDTSKGKIVSDSSIPITYYLNGRKVGNPVVNINEWNVLGISFSEPLDISNSQGRIFITSPVLINNISYHYANETELKQKASFFLWSQIKDNKWRIPVPTQTPTRVGNAITLTTTGNHNLVAGERLTFYDIIPDGYRTGFAGAALKVFEVNTDTSFTYVNSNAPLNAISTAGSLAGTWQYSTIPNYYSVYGSLPDTIYGEFVGKNRISIDTYEDSLALKLNKYQYASYMDVKIDSFVLELK